MQNEQIAKMLNANFGAPYLPKDFVRAKVNDDGDLIIHIGSRDVQVDADGEFIGAGTDLVKYSVEQRFLPELMKAIKLRELEKGD